MTKKNILLVGGTGFIGRYLAPYLANNGYNVTLLLHRNPPKHQPHPAITSIKSYDEAHQHYYNIIINLAGDNLSKGRWTKHKKLRMRHSRLDSTRQILHYINHAAIKPELLINGSAVGYYGHHNSHHFTEQDTAPNTVPTQENQPNAMSFAQQLCVDWEHVAMQAATHNVRTCLLRTGIVLGRKGGILQQLLPPFIMGLGGVIGGGQQYMSWIHIDDMLAMIQHIIDTPFINNGYNACAPNPVTNKEFTNILAKNLRRPALLPMPSLMTRILFGEMADELLLNGQYVYPEKALNTGYIFTYPTLSQALQALL